MQHLQQKRLTLLACILFAFTFFFAYPALSQEAVNSEEKRKENSNKKTNTEPKPKRKIAMPVFVSDSNTGYIDNAYIRTRFQIRFDSGSNANTPDRAEFFYGACGCARVVPLPPQNTPRPDGEVLNPEAPGPVGPVIPGAILSSPLIETSLDYQDIRLDYEHAFNERFSVFVEAPIRFIDGDVIGSTEGLADVRAGFKWGLVNSASHQLTFQLKAYLPTGDAEEGLGSDHTSIEPGLLYFRRIDEHWTTSAELRYLYSTGGTNGRSTGFDEDYDGDIVRYGLGVGYDFMMSDTTRVTPVLELVSWIVLGGLALESSDGTPMTAQYRQTDGDTITNLKFGLRVNFERDRSIYIGYGKSLTDEWWYDDIIRAEFRTGF
mgnify:CR=1 FL=1